MCCRSLHTRSDGILSVIKLNLHLFITFPFNGAVQMSTSFSIPGRGWGGIMIDRWWFISLFDHWSLHLILSLVTQRLGIDAAACNSAEYNWTAVVDSTLQFCDLLVLLGKEKVTYNNSHLDWLFILHAYFQNALIWRTNWLKPCCYSRVWKNTFKLRANELLRQWSYLIVARQNAYAITKNVWKIR